MIALGELAEHFQLHRQVLQLSPQTLVAQQRELRRFLGFLCAQNIDHAAGLRRAHIEAYQHWLFHEPSARGRPRSIGAQRHALIVARHFLRFLHKQGHTVRDLGANVRYPRRLHTLPRGVLTPAEARRILEAPDTQTPAGYRDRVILEVLYATGIRKSELLNLTPAQVNLEEELLRINQGKGGKDRVVPLSRIACAMLQIYLTAVRPKLLEPRASSATERLIVSTWGRPMSRTNLAHLVEKYGRAAGIKKRVTPHVWRHTCATHLVKNRANLRHVQEILGHRSLATTERYLSLTITDLKEAHRKFHPRERGPS